VVGRRSGRKIAVVGGLLSKWRRYLVHDGVRCYGSAHHTGNGELRRLLAAIHNGRLREVWILWRWIGHSEVGAIIKACRANRTPYRLVSSISSARRELSGR